MGKKSILHYVKRGKFAKVASLLHPGCHQGPTRTALDRYPEIFAAAAVAAPDARRILSSAARPERNASRSPLIFQRRRSLAPTSIR
jgi:hypothetical protein